MAETLLASAVAVAYKQVAGGPKAAVAAGPAVLPVLWEPFPPPPLFMDTPYKR